MKHLRLLCFLLYLTAFWQGSIINGKDLPEYEIEGAGTATQGNYLVRTTVLTKNKKISDKEIARAAVHGVLFRGFSDSSNRISQKPLAGNAANEAQHIDFYSAFFDEKGSAANYASVLNGSRTIIKVDKKYKISAIVTVNKELLHKYLEEAGIIKGLNSIF